jgi:hypothetical protein
MIKKEVDALIERGKNPRKLTDDELITAMQWAIAFNKPRKGLEREIIKQTMLWTGFWKHHWSDVRWPGRNKRLRKDFVVTRNLRMMARDGKLVEQRKMLRA